MGDDADKQIKQMIAFIEQEAQEKKDEIMVKAEEEYTIQKLNLVQAAKTKIRQEYEKKEENLIIKQRIDRSQQINASRKVTMQAVHKLVEAAKESTLAKLASASSDARYPVLLQALIVQGLLRLNEEEVRLQIRKEDKNLVEGVLAASIKQYQQITKERTGQDVKCKITIDDKNLPPGPSAQNAGAVSCCGGVVLLAHGNCIAVDNTLDARLELGYEQLKPQLRNTLFGSFRKETRVRDPIKRTEHASAVKHGKK
jgi:V-type H+-transporting ATPase subunit E